MQSISPTLLLSLQSNYLIEGYKKDSVSLVDINYSTDECSGVFKFTEAYTSSDGGFHLSMTTVTNCISQLGIVYAGLLNGLSKKESEVYVIEYRIKFSKPILNYIFNITASMTDIHRKKDAIIYTMAGGVENNSFTYEVTFFFLFEVG